ncbi:MAG: RNA-splicing ligase RtcB [Armatimonadetes bacterium CG_4_10_14_3_um_filter_66_18]|nr:RtcB family protein [Armatimonadota bacterium]OIO98599.1 MAG: RNA-splicing ligase RtcB [Armatimonadetes bacterium CG2_30_66_41]PIU87664.1 MAG: RNA-splicing ligase RtcB [Armatimonadetes bacterium CG06_land_8_20_14_3_00_66_21]PIX42889.1 MAG: RNA-splicing ligase RtcB [Armatimonadetes bacterium CG_4_8_14_3_um_filter_66_20]PIY37507.1 MAG: RNA-splicing ligase RtcB [Armatimonadetes bacterium CG_4_10_14_3_um_filter_66_18]PIZ30359.1 MAG: RNA-splicing ligase RtcB [Armatimonadetes bacterium CG_4_10_14
MSNAWAGKLEKIDNYRWRIPKGYRPEMQTDGIVYGSERIVDEMRQDQALEQLANVACLPGLVGPAMVMPDGHYGYGFPIGGVAASATAGGVVSPGGVGYDINCGVRLVRTELTREDVEPHLEQLVHQLFRDVPSGVGSSGAISLSETELRQVAQRGAEWAVSRGMGSGDDLAHCEEAGALDGADDSAVSPRARKRGSDQLGTLGSGNHFLEVQVVEEIYDAEKAQAFGLLDPGQVTVMIHTGSRGYGYQICDDSLVVMQQAVRKYDIPLPDRQLACVPFGSPEAERYLAAMRCAANYAWCNRQVITHRVRGAFEKVFGLGERKLGMWLVYDVAHNIAKVETHEYAGRKVEVCVHRKGATRAFGPGQPQVPEDYRAVGQPVIVPGDMGSCSYLLAGTQRGMEQSFGSTCHGAGRVMSRTQAIKQGRGRDLAGELKKQGIFVRAQGRDTLAEEAPYAYKDVSAVVDSCSGAGIAVKVAKLRPLGVVKG